MALPKERLVMSDFRPSRAFLKRVAASCLDHRECSLHELTAQITHYSENVLDEWLATALYYGATAPEIRNVVEQSSCHFEPSKAIAVGDQVADSLRSLTGRLHHA